MDKWKETADKRNILEKIKPYQKKENNDLLKEYFDRWKNATDKNKILRNMKNQKQLANRIKNIDKSKNINDLKNILINGKIMQLTHIQNRKEYLVEEALKNIKIKVKLKKIKNKNY